MYVNPKIRMMKSLILKTRMMWRIQEEILMPLVVGKASRRVKWHWKKPTPRIYAEGVKDASNDLRSTWRQYKSSSYQSIFFSYYYYCTNFGHMGKDCRAYHKNKYNGSLEETFQDEVMIPHSWTRLKASNSITLDIWLMIITWLCSLNNIKP